MSTFVARSISSGILTLAALLVSLSGCDGGTSHEDNAETADIPSAADSCAFTPAPCSVIVMTDGYRSSLRMFPTLASVGKLADGLSTSRSAICYIFGIILTTPTPF